MVVTATTTTIRTTTKTATICCWYQQRRIPFVVFVVAGMALLLTAPTTILREASAFGFGGGSGCGCPCSCLPPIALPSLCFPQISLPCPPPSPCGCGCGRKKRSALAAVVTGTAGIDRDCNNPQIRRLIRKNLGAFPSESKSAIHSELKAKLGGDFVVVCSMTPPKKLSGYSFAADFPASFCTDGNELQTCTVFSL